MWKHHGDDAWVIWGVLDVALPLQELEDKPLGGQREKLWCDFFLDPLQWWDHRSKKLGGHKCKMCEAQICLESDVQPNVISRCGLMEYHDIGTCEMQAGAEGTGSISINATRQCLTRLCYFCGGAECMC